MPKLIDLTGQDFGYWHVIERDKNSQKKGVYWICQCKCGNIKSVNSQNLRRKTSTNCGCKNLRPIQVGEKYNRLTILEITDKKSNDNQPIIKCKCDCGNICYVQKRHILEGHTKSCGCYSKEQISIKNSKDITNQIFGELIALYSTNTIDNYRNKIWHCKCSCGRECDVPLHDLTSGNTKSCGHVKSYQERNIASLLEKNNINYQREYKFEDLKDKSYLKFDFAIIKNNKIICLIEYNGIQHYDKNNPWYSEDIYSHDLLKIKYCKEKNYPLFILTKEDDLIKSIMEVKELYDGKII